MKRLICLLICVLLLLQTICVESFANTNVSAVNGITIYTDENCQVKYECDFIYSGSGAIVLKLGEKELFSIQNQTLKLGGTGVSGKYAQGNYHFKTYINPVQEMVSLEVTLPEGGYIKRGYETLLGGNEILCAIDGESEIKNEETAYCAALTELYSYDASEPYYSGFENSVYNLTTSFDDAKTTRNFAWTVVEDFVGDSEMAVKYRPAGMQEWMVADAIKDPGSSKIDTEDYYKCDITGLIPGTTYEYKIGKKDCMDEVLDWGKIHTFRTSDNDVDAFSFLAIGDTQGREWVGTGSKKRGYIYTQAAYRKAFEAVENPAFILHTGDVVQQGNERLFWNRFFKALGGYAETTPMFAAVGNHDTWGDPFLFEYHFNHPNSGGINAVDQSVLNEITDVNIQRMLLDYDETVYSYDYGKAHFIVLNTGSYGNDDAILQEAQKEWLIQDLESHKDAQWTVIICHKPVYHRNGGKANNLVLRDVIESYDVDLVMQGHCHLLTRTYPMKDGKIVSKQNPYVIQKASGTVYMTIGSTDPCHDGIGEAKHVEKMEILMTPSATQPVYTTVNVTPDQMTVTTKQVNGLVLDKFVISENPDSVNKDSLIAEPEQVSEPHPEKDPEENIDSTTDPDPQYHSCTSTETKIIRASKKKNGKISYICSCGKVVNAETINKISKVNLGLKTAVYNGKQRNPKVIVKDSHGNTLKKNRDYIVTVPKGRTKIGKYIYNVNFKGNYSGSKKLTLTITPPKTSIRPPVAAKKSLIVKWKAIPKAKRTQVTGYEILVSANKYFNKGNKKITVKGYRKASRKITKLKPKTRYYVKVRTYKNVKGVKIYSGWSKVKAINTK